MIQHLKKVHLFTTLVEPELEKIGKNCKTGLDKILIMDRELGYKLLWAFTRTRSKRLRETNEKMAGFLSMTGGF